MVQYRNFSSVMVCILLTLFAVNVFGQTKIFSREQMVQDIDTLFSTIEKVHPDMYAVYPKQQLGKDIERIKTELKTSGDVFYFFRQVTPLVVRLGDGHTNLFPPFHEPEDFANVPLFPVSVKITYPEKEIFVRDGPIPAEAQIISINNRTAESIVQEMMNYSSGEKDFFRIGKIEQLFIPLMSVLYGDSIFVVEFLLNHEKHSRQIKAISIEEITQTMSQQNSSVPSYTFLTLPNKNIGIIEFNSFVDLDRFKVFLDSTFQVLQKENIENLIIDIRKNGGGNSVLGDEMFQYISSVPFAQFGKTIVKYSDNLKRFYKTNYDWEISNPNGIEIVNENVTLIEPRENNLRYTGNLFLLTSHSTFSSASKFSWAFKYFKMGTVIGEETGGMAVTFGDMITQKLPNTGLLYSISHKRFYSYGATDENTHGTLPDYEVKADKALDYTICLVLK